MQPYTHFTPALKLLLLGATLFTAVPAMADSRLIGTWATEQSEGGAGGTIRFKKSGIVKLQPDGFPVVPGTWKTKNGMLAMTAPNMGESVAGFYFSENGAELTLRYPNGSKQVFKRTADKASSEPAAGAPVPPTKGK